MVLIKFWFSPENRIIWYVIMTMFIVLYFTIGWPTYLWAAAIGVWCGIIIASLHSYNSFKRQEQKLRELRKLRNKEKQDAT